MLLAGCRVDATVDVALRSNGSGTLTSTLTFDADAVRQLGGATYLPRSVPLDGLVAAGWTVGSFTTAPNGSIQLTVTHRFSDTADLTRRLADLAGVHGVLRDPRITHSRGLFSSTDGLSLVVDMRAPSPGITSDAALAARLRAAGIDPVALQANLANRLKTSLHLSVVVHLPNGQSRTYAATNGTLTTATLSRRATDWNRVVKLGIAFVLMLLAATFALAAAMSARRERRRRRERVLPEPERVPLM